MVPLKINLQKSPKMYWACEKGYGQRVNCGMKGRKNGKTREQDEGEKAKETGSNSNLKSKQNKNRDKHRNSIIAALRVLLE